MSQEFDFYFAKMDENGKISFFDNYTYLDEELEMEEDGRWKKSKWKIKKPLTIEARCASFAYDIDEELYECSENEFSEEMRKAFYTRDWNNNKVFDRTLKCITFEEFFKLNDDYIKKGFFLVDDVAEYEKTGDSEGLFYTCASPLEYANLASKQIKRSTEKDEEGFEHIKYGWEDYMYYAYPEYQCKEYVIHVLKILMSSALDTLPFEYHNGDKCYLLMNVL